MTFEKSLVDLNVETVEAALGPRKGKKAVATGWVEILKDFRKMYPKGCIPKPKPKPGLRLGKPTISDPLTDKSPTRRRVKKNQKQTLSKSEAKTQRLRIVF